MISVSMLPQNRPFDSVTGDLLPEYRDAYLQGGLPPAVASAVEDYLKRSSVQTSVALGRYHQLSEEAMRGGRTLAAPPWVQRQLVFQPSTSRVGPLRRPVVRLAGGMLALLSVASVVQWMRNEPLVPAPVAAAVASAAQSVSQASKQLAQQGLETLHLTSPAPAAPPETAAPAASSPAAVARPAATRAAVVQPAPVLPAEPRPVGLQLPGAPENSSPSSASPNQTEAEIGPVRGHIFDQDGQPLAGATVLVVGTQQATSTNASGEFTLEVPAGAVLQFSYVGYADQIVKSDPFIQVDVLLQEQLPIR